MIPYAEVKARQRQAEQREFRKYLVDSGAVKSLVKMKMHAIKNEMRVDNPKLAVDFVSKLDARTPENIESESLAASSAALRKRNQELEAQAAQLQLQVRKAAATRLWEGLVAEAFWQPRGTDAAGFVTKGMSGEQLYERMCGNAADPAADNQVLVNFLRPPPLMTKTMPRRLFKSNFLHWMLHLAPTDVVDWCTADLVPRLREAPEDAPFEFDVISDLRASHLYPERIREAAFGEEGVPLAPQGLVLFLRSIDDCFGGALARVPLARKFHHGDPEAELSNRTPPSAEFLLKNQGAKQEAVIESFDHVKQVVVLSNGAELSVHPRDIGALEEILAAHAEGEGAVMAECTSGVL